MGNHVESDKQTREQMQNNNKQERARQSHTNECKTLSKPLDALNSRRRNNKIETQPRKRTTNVYGTACQKVHIPYTELSTPPQFYRQLWKRSNGTAVLQRKHENLSLQDRRNKIPAAEVNTARMKNGRKFGGPKKKWTAPQFYSMLRTCNEYGRSQAQNNFEQPVRRIIRKKLKFIKKHWKNV